MEKALVAAHVVGSLSWLRKSGLRMQSLSQALEFHDRREDGLAAQRGVCGEAALLAWPSFAHTLWRR